MKFKEVCKKTWLVGAPMYGIGDALSQVKVKPFKKLGEFMKQHPVAATAAFIIAVAETVLLAGAVATAAACAVLGVVYVVAGVSIALGIVLIAGGVLAGASSFVTALALLILLGVDTAKQISKAHKD